VCRFTANSKIAWIFDAIEEAHLYVSFPKSFSDFRIRKKRENFPDRNLDRKYALTGMEAYFKLTAHE